MTDDEYIAALQDFRTRRKENIRLALARLNEVTVPPHIPLSWDESFDLNGIRIAAEALLKPWRTE